MFICVCYLYEGGAGQEVKPLQSHLNPISRPLCTASQMAFTSILGLLKSHKIHRLKAIRPHSSACTHTHTHTQAHTHTHTHSSTHTHTHTHTHTQARARTHSSMHTHTHTQACTHSSAHTHTLKLTHTHTHTHTHSQAHTHTQALTHTHTHTRTETDVALMTPALKAVCVCVASLVACVAVWYHISSLVSIYGWGLELQAWIWVLWNGCRSDIYCIIHIISILFCCFCRWSLHCCKGIHSLSYLLI